MAKYVKFDDIIKFEFPGLYSFNCEFYRSLQKMDLKCCEAIDFANSKEFQKWLEFLKEISGKKWFAKPTAIKIFQNILVLNRRGEI
jgi:hypothetical protein